MTDKWAGEVPALYARRQGWKEGVSVVEGVFKRVGWGAYYLVEETR
jgi:hypothetical protein